MEKTDALHRFTLKKASTAAELCWDVRYTVALPEIKERLIWLAKSGRLGNLIRHSNPR